MTLTKYSMWTLMRSVKIFYLVWLAIAILMAIVGGVAKVNYPEAQITFNGFDTSAAIFVFICGIVLFSELFKVAMANSQTRKNVFISAVSVTLPLAVLTSVGGQLISAVISMFLKSQSIFTLLYIRDSSELFKVGTIFKNFLWDISLAVMLFAIGFLIGMLYYRLSRFGKVVLSFAAFGIPFMIFPMIDTILTDGKTIIKVFSFLGNCLGITNGNPFWAVLSFVVIAALMYCISFFVIRKLPVKKV